MELEFLTSDLSSDEARQVGTYQFDVQDWKTPTSNLEPQFTIDWFPLITGILEDVRRQVSLSIISTKFHNTLVEIIITIANRIKIHHIVLSGGCFRIAILLNEPCNVYRKKVSGLTGISVSLQMMVELP